MRNLFLLFVLVCFLAAVQPATAQLRSEVPKSDKAPTKLYKQDATSFSLNDLFDPADFRMNHSYTFSAGSFGGGGYSYGLYTNSMRWQPSNKLAARVDVGFMHSPFSALSGNASGLNGRVYLRNAQIAYRPAENIQLNFTVRQNPYGRYMRPYGHYGYSAAPGAFHGQNLQTNPQSLFWKDHQ